MAPSSTESALQPSAVSASSHARSLAVAQFDDGCSHYRSASRRGLPGGGGAVGVRRQAAPPDEAWDSLGQTLCRILEERLRGFKNLVHAAARWYSWMSPPRSSCDPSRPNRSPVGS